MTMPDEWFRPLTTEEEQEFRRWARENWEPGREVNGLWHPVVRDECRKMEVEYAQERMG